MIDFISCRATKKMKQPHQDKERITNLIYNQHLTLKEVASQYNVSRQAIHQLLEKWRLPPVSLIKERKHPKHGKPRQSLYERFMDHVEITDDHWIWTGYKLRGYGKVTWSRQTKEAYAHRISWILFRGDILKGEWISHTCNRKDCVNPTHLKRHKPLTSSFQTSNLYR